MTTTPETVAAGAGLREDEAAARLLRDGPNTLPPAPRPSLAARLVRELREPMAVLLLGAAAVSGAVLGEATEAAAIAVIVVINAVIALVQEGRAERAMAALERLEAPTATIVRDARRRLVPAAELVVGDRVWSRPVTGCRPTWSSPAATGSRPTRPSSPASPCRSPSGRVERRRRRCRWATATGACTVARW